MEIELIPEKSYTVRANGREIHGMRVVGEWEGLRKLEDADGSCLIVADADSPLVAAFSEQFGRFMGNEGRRCIVITGSPDLMLELAKGAWRSDSDCAEAGSGPELTTQISDSQ